VGADAADYALVALLGGLVSIGELSSRYRDAPGRAISSLSAGVYVALNVAATLAALALIRVFDVNFGDLTGDKLRWTQVLVAGFGAIAVFRSSVFIARVGDQDVGMGPSGVLEALLKVADRGVDRSRAKARATEVASAMQGVSFEQAQVALPTYCFALMQNVTREEQEVVADQIVGKLRTANMPDSTKALALGLALMNIVGDGVLLAAVDTFLDRSGAKARAKEVASAMKGVSFGRAAVALPTYCFALTQNVTPEQQEVVAQIVGKLGAASLPDSTKALALGLALMNIFGDGVFLAAVDTLQKELKPEEAGTPQGP
jgi:hypothetical protein